jgi:hypothetical protein
MLRLATTGLARASAELQIALETTICHTLVLFKHGVAKCFICKKSITKRFISERTFRSNLSSDRSLEVPAPVLAFLGTVRNIACFADWCVGTRGLVSNEEKTGDRVHFSTDGRFLLSALCFDSHDARDRMTGCARTL